MFNSFFDMRIVCNNNGTEFDICTLFFIIIGLGGKYVKMPLLFFVLCRQEKECFLLLCVCGKKLRIF